ncbi:MAG: tRNA uridine-5-carboxymethylaminomethyl(34) synthesis GTPase MnmE [Planctomycetota bacterium]|nr:MAG: tRNA uridine-5-carboxymethylaminomethyl(34) synthesis GTPase MnmE [Planctomycetota bacterium]
MTFTLEDTIAAIATASGGALRGILRISGPRAIKTVSQCVTDAAARRQLEAVRVPTVVRAGVALDRDASLPCELFVWPTERSYTRQIVVEIHTLGSPPLLDAALRAVCAAGARLASPGEFTLRAFLSGRLDLAQAEAVLGIIDAQDRRALDVALAQLAGGLSRPLGTLRDALVDLLADLEAGLDFVDEDIEFVSAEQVQARLAGAATEARGILRQLATRSERADAFRVVLTGPPNAGKSSLFNALAGGSAIVSDVPGTTRDALVARVEFDGIACELIDTAGMTEAEAAEAEPATVDAGTIDAAAQAQSRTRIATADLELACIDATQPIAPKRLVASRARRLLVVTKADLLARAAPRTPRPASLLTSSLTGQGLAELRCAIAAAAREAIHGETAVVASTAARCEESLRLSVAAIEEAGQLAAVRSGDELIAAELRLALAELGKVVGTVYTDDILDRLFGRFCIGK